MAKEIENKKVEEEVVNEVENKEVENKELETKEIEDTASRRLTKKQAIAALKKEGAKEYKNLVVKSVRYEKMANYTRIGITLDTEIPAYREGDDGEIVKTTSRFFFLSSYSLATELRENEITAFVANRIIDKPQNIPFVLTGAKIDVIQEEIVVPDGETVSWKNIFAEGNTEPTEFDHSIIVNHLVGYNPSKANLKLVDKIIDKMMDEDDDN